VVPYQEVMGMVKNNRIVHLTEVLHQLFKVAGLPAGQFK